MKAFAILEILSRCGLGKDEWGICFMGKKYPFVEMFGAEPMGTFVPGHYVWVNVAHVSDEAFEYLENGADHVLFGPDPEEQCTIIIKIEDAYE